jgi:hypothetical protein
MNFSSKALTQISWMFRTGSVLDITDVHYLVGNVPELKEKVVPADLPLAGNELGQNPSRKTKQGLQERFACPKSLLLLQSLWCWTESCLNQNPPYSKPPCLN